MSVPHKNDNAEDSCLKNHTAALGQQGTETNNHGPIGPLSTGQKGDHTAASNSDEPPSESPSLEQTVGDACDDKFPEGGIAAWLVVFGSFCALFAVYGLINTSAVFATYFKDHLLSDYTPSQIGWIFSLYLFLVFFAGVQVGPVFDRHGPRWLVAIGFLLIVASLMLLSLCKEYYQIILTYSVMGGLGGALLNAPAYSAIAHFFNARRGLATGIASTAGGVGGIVFPLLLRHLLSPEGVGFAWSCRILGFFMLGLAIPANLFIRSNPKVQALEHEKPKTASIWPDLSVFRDVGFALASVGFFFMEWGLFVPLTYVVSYGTAYGVSLSDSSLLLSLLNAGSVVGRFLPGFLSDKLGRFNIIIVTIALCAVTVLAIWLPARGSYAVLIVFCVLFGVASGSNLGLIPVCLGQFCDAQDYGRYFATSAMFASFGTLSSVPIAGALLEIEDQDTGWTALVLFAGCSYVVALVCYIAARVLMVGWLPQTKF
ncbi:hypothetical protein NLU13_7038 [Sarocladium strictum]|uniref:Major facilitator superfamily (MFS) profile domain-containing protein n=1 Tax=Sarocladium strictum TaxID=5046 RepID=A0AA39L623_SARSR|nr:hypothetical protein NLU13_7038 [Sarocladium strictum]